MGYSELTLHCLKKIYQIEWKYVRDNLKHWIKKKYEILLVLIIFMMNLKQIIYDWYLT